MKNHFTYYMPTNIIYGENSLETIDKYIKGRKTLLVTSQGFVKRGLVENIKSITPNIVGVVTDIKSHPEFNDLEIIYSDIRDINYELILAVGGGSALDASKLFSVKSKDSLEDSNKEYQFVKDIITGKIEKKNYKLTPIISIPTTSGTGSEITPWATIWDMEEKKKYSLSLPDLFSEVALYDPTLTLSVPKDITIQTGLDTLSHALESIWNKNANTITINYAIKSAKLVVDNLVNLSNNLDNLKYRDNIMKASMYAGLAFCHTQTAIAHSMSYYITAHKNVDHGIACSFTLPMLIDSIIGKYKFIDEAIIEIFGELSSLKLRDILNKLDISVEFNYYNVSLEEVLNELDKSRLSNSLITIDNILLNRGDGIC